MRLRLLTLSLIVLAFIVVRATGRSAASPQPDPELPMVTQAAAPETKASVPASVASFQRPATSPTPSPSAKDEDQLSIYFDQGRFGFMNSKGEIVVHPEFDEASEFSEHRAVVKQFGKFGYINEKGDAVVPPSFDYAWPIHDGVGLVKNNDLYGLVDARGEVIAQPIYETVFTSSGDLTAVKLPGPDGKFGFIDHTGSFVIPPQYDYAWPFGHDGRTWVRQNGEDFLIDRAGRRVDPAN